MKLIALKDFSPDGSRKLKKGETFEISDSSAGILIATKRAKLAEEPPKRKTYNRRDLNAAD